MFRGGILGCCDCILGHFSLFQGSILGSFEAFWALQKHFGVLGNRGMFWSIAAAFWGVSLGYRGSFLRHFRVFLGNVSGQHFGVFLSGILGCFGVSGQYFGAFESFLGWCFGRAF